MLNLIKDSLPKITVLKQYGKIFINKNKKYKKVFKKVLHYYFRGGILLLVLKKRAKQK
jgi:hypothetical protein